MNTVMSRILKQSLSLNLLCPLWLTAMTHHNINVDAAAERAQQFAQSMATGTPIPEATNAPPQEQSQEPIAHTTMPAQIYDIMRAYVHPWEHVEALNTYNGIKHQRLLKINDTDSYIKRIIPLAQHKLLYHAHTFNYETYRGFVQQLSILDLATEKIIATQFFRGEVNFILELAAGTLAILENGSHQQVIIWNIHTDHIHRIFDKAETDLRSITYFTDTTLALCYPHSIKLYDISKNSFMPTELTHAPAIKGMGSSLDGSIFFYDDQSFNIWRPETNKIVSHKALKDDTEKITFVEQLSDNSFCIFVSDTTGTLYLCRLEPEDLRIETEERIVVDKTCVLLDTERSLLVYPQGSRYIQIADNIIALNKIKNIQLHDMTGKLLATLTQPEKDDFIGITQLFDRSICAYSTKSIYRWVIDPNLSKLIFKELTADSFNRLIAEKPAATTSPEKSKKCPKLDTRCVIL